MLQSRSSEIKLVKPLKNCFLDPICTEKRSLWATHMMENFFFGRNNKSRSSAFRKFLFYQNIIFFDWVMDLSLSWVMFSVKKVSFPAKTAVHIQCVIIIISSINIVILLLLIIIIIIITLFYFDKIIQSKIYYKNQAQLQKADLLHRI